MKRLVIYPTFLCPFSCAFCSTRDKNSLNEMLDIKLMNKKVSKILELTDISEIVISGGEPMSWKNTYFNILIDTLKQFNKKIIVESYPYTLDNYRNDIEYNFSYDFMVRPRALDVWENLLRIKEPYNITITISPMLFKLYPNAILYKLTLLKNVKEVEFIPYYKNTISQYDITKNDSLTKFNKMILSNKLNLPFTLKNKINLVNKMLGEYNCEADICLMPNGDIKLKTFDKGIMNFIPADDSMIKSSNNLEYPAEIDLYNDEIVNWAKENAII